VKLTFRWFLSEIKVLAVAAGRSFVMINQGETSTYNKGLAWLLYQRIGSVYHNKGPASFTWRTRWEKGVRYFNQKWTLSRMLQISHAVLFRYVKQCPVVFALKFASFSRYCVCNKPLGFSNLCAFFAYVISRERRATQRKKLQSNVPQAKRSPHAKIQLVLSTFKNGRKI